ncbi:hypothetical protein QYF36_004331 [Acer negundo]|nr:hypothetical protein QYF36_004331 [Acer negundo]
MSRRAQTLAFSKSTVIFFESYETPRRRLFRNSPSSVSSIQSEITGFCRVFLIVRSTKSTETAPDCKSPIRFTVAVLPNTNLAGDAFSSEQGFLLRVVSEIVKEQIEEISVPSDFGLCVLGIFRKSVGVADFWGKSGLPTDSIAINVPGYLVSILRDICVPEDPSGFGSDSEDSVDVVDRLISSGLIELFLSLLRDLEPPTTIRKAMRLSQNQEGTSSYSAKTCPYMGFRKDIVVVICSCAYRRKHVQDEIRGRNGILLLLQQCVVDEENQFLREWGIWW